MTCCVRFSQLPGEYVTSRNVLSPLHCMEFCNAVHTLPRIMSRLCLYLHATGDERPKAPRTSKMLTVMTWMMKSSFSTWMMCSKVSSTSLLIPFFTWLACCLSQQSTCCDRSSQLPSRLHACDHQSGGGHSTASIAVS